MSVEKLNAEMWDPDTDPDVKVRACPTHFGCVQASFVWHACVRPHQVKAIIINDSSTKQDRNRSSDALAASRRAGSSQVHISALLIHDAGWLQAVYRSSQARPTSALEAWRERDRSCLPAVEFPNDTWMFMFVVPDVLTCRRVCDAQGEGILEAERADRRANTSHCIST